MTQFHTQQPRPLWMSLECSLYPNKEISHLMWMKGKDRLVMLCPTLTFSLHLWDRLLASHGFKYLHTPLAPLFGNPPFTPGLHSHNFAWWTNKGLIRIAGFCDHTGVLSKQVLQEKCHLPNSELYRHTQITHFLGTLNCTSELTTSNSMEYLCRTFNKLATYQAFTVFFLLYFYRVIQAVKMEARFRNQFGSWRME